MPGRRHERGTQVGPHLAGRHGRQVGHPLVRPRVGHAQGGALADHDRRERSGQERGTADDAGRQTVTADHGVLVGEEGDLGVPGVEDPSRQPRQPVERSRAGHFDQQPAGGSHALAVVQHVGLEPAVLLRGHARPLHDRPLTGGDGRSAHMLARPRPDPPGGPPSFRSGTGPARLTRATLWSLLKLGPGPADDSGVEGVRTALLPDCRPLLADPDDLTLVFQPIVDLAGATIAGYEALARFPGSAGPDVWFAAAAEAGIAAELEALDCSRARRWPPSRTCRPTPS